MTHLAHALRSRLLVAVLLGTLASRAGAIVPRSCLITIPSDQETGTVFAIHALENSALVTTSEGLFRYRADSLAKVSEKLDFLSVHMVSKGILIGSVQGIYWYKGGLLNSIPSDAAAKAINDILELPDGEMLLATDTGLFRYRDHALHKVLYGGAIPRAFRLQQIGGEVLVTTTGSSLLRYRNGVLQAVVPDVETGKTFGAYEVGGVGLVTTDNGLFRYRDGSLHQVPSATAVGQTASVQVLNFGIFVPSSEGLFRYQNARLNKVPSDSETGGVSRVYPLGQSSMVAAENGLFELKHGRLTKVQSSFPTERIAQVYRLRGQTVVRAKDGLFYYRKGELHKVPSDTETGGFFAVRQVGEAVLAQTDNGIFSYYQESLTKVPADREIKEVYALVKSQGSVLVGGPQGLFRYVVAPARSATATVERRVLQSGVNDLRTIKANIDYVCATTLELGDLELVRAGGPIDYLQDVSDELLSKNNDGTVTWSGRVTFPQAGTHSVQLALAESGQFVPISRPIEFRVEWGVTDWLRHLAPWLIAVHSLFYLGLFVGARWSGWCWRVVSDPIWGKAGVWSYFGMRFVGPLQQWIMAYWFDEVRRSLKKVVFVPLPLTDDTGEALSLADLPDRLTVARRLWIQGNAGMGKTVLVDALEERVFGDPDMCSLSAARKHFGFVPIVVRLRRFANIKPNLSHPELFVPELARRAVAERGPEFRDAGLFRSVLENGAFAVVLDGENEIPDGDYLELSACAITPRCGVLFTSQSLPTQRPDAFQVLRLPPTIGDTLKPLLEEFLGHAKGRAVSERIAASPLANAIRSGYDARLLADLIEATPGSAEVPRDRLGLYQAIVGGATLPDGSPFPEEALCKAAWEMWRAGERRLIPNKHLPKDLVSLLWQERRKVLRNLDGETFEFRHDQMRGFLAARWLAIHTVAPLRPLQDDASVWRVSRSDQEVVWSFFSAMITEDWGIEIWRWATGAAERAVLQQALQQRARNEGWYLSMPRPPLS